MHDHFLKLICDNPADIGPRLVYADWLEEQGDPRGEFIRVQCALDGIAANDPQHAALKKRERELLGHHEKEWLRPLEQLLGPNEPRQPVAAVTGWLGSLLPRAISRAIRGAATYAFPLWSARFRKGFVEEIDIESARMQDVGVELTKKIPLRNLDVRSYGPNEVESLNWLNASITKCVTDLTIHAWRIEPERWQAAWTINPCPALERLHITALPSHGLVAVAQSGVGNQLCELSFNGSQLVESDIVDLNQFTNLTALDFLGALPDVEVFVHLTQQQVCLRLRSAHFLQCPLGNAAMLHFLQPRFPKLENVGFSMCELGDSAAESLANNNLLRQLAELHLNNNAISDVGAMALADSPNFIGKTRIHLHSNPISPDVRRALKIRFGDRMCFGDS